MIVTFAILLASLVHIKTQGLFNVILLVIVSILTVVQFKYIERRVHY